MLWKKLFLTKIKWKKEEDCNILSFIFNIYNIFKLSSAMLAQWIIFTDIIYILFNVNNKLKTVCIVPYLSLFTS